MTEEFSRDSSKSDGVDALLSTKRDADAINDQSSCDNWDKNAFYETPPQGTKLYSNQKNHLRQRITNYLSETKKTLLQQNEPEFLREDFSTRLSSWVRRPRNAFFFFSAVAGVLLLLVWYALYSTSTTIGAVNYKELSDIKLSSMSTIVTAHDTGSAYRTGALPVTCENIRSDEWNGYKLSTVIARLRTASAELNSSCVCAPQTGIAARIAVSGAFVMYNPVAVKLPWYWRLSDIRTTTLETSSLYPGRAPVEVLRHAAVNIAYMSQTCEDTAIIGEDKDTAVCLQACLQLLDGKTVYDLQEKT